jgi:hypothetical protein
MMMALRTDSEKAQKILAYLRHELDIPARCQVVNIEFTFPGIIKVTATYLPKDEDE